MLYFLI